MNIYVDGFNLYHAIASFKDHKLKWLNLRELGRSFLRPGERLNRVMFFTAVLTWDLQKQQRHKNYIRALLASNVEVVESKFRKVRKHCPIMDRYCTRHEEKQTDVAIATSLFAHAVGEDFNRAILVTADSDQVPVVREMLRKFPKKTLTLAVPPGRGGESRELGSLFSPEERTPISLGRIRACLLPRDVFNVEGLKVATMPSLYSQA